MAGARVETQAAVAEREAESPSRKEARAGTASFSADAGWGEEEGG